MHAATLIQGEDQVDGWTLHRGNYLLRGNLLRASSILVASSRLVASRLVASRLVATPTVHLATPAILLAFGSLRMEEGTAVATCARRTKMAEFRVCVLAATAIWWGTLAGVPV